MVICTKLNYFNAWCGLSVHGYHLVISYVCIHSYCGKDISSEFLIVTDINECLITNGGCSHTCNNTVGSYYCKCPTGYVLQPNNHDCEGECYKLSLGLTTYHYSRKILMAPIFEDFEVLLSLENFILNFFNSQELIIAK